MAISTAACVLRECIVGTRMLRQPRHCSRRGHWGARRCARSAHDVNYHDANELEALHFALFEQVDGA